MVMKDETVEMKDLFNRLSQVEDSAQSVISRDSTINESSVEVRTSTKQVDPVIKNILEKFNRIENGEHVAISESTKSVAPTPFLKYIGENEEHWEVKKMGPNNYSIHDAKSDFVILEDVYSSDSARLITALLNEGRKVNSRQVTAVLRIDEDMKFHFSEALNYKDKFIKTRNESYMSRFKFCKNKVVHLKEKIKRHPKML